MADGFHPPCPSPRPSPSHRWLSADFCYHLVTPLFVFFENSEYYFFCISSISTQPHMMLSDFSLPHPPIITFSPSPLTLTPLDCTLHHPQWASAAPSKAPSPPLPPPAPMTTTLLSRSPPQRLHVAMVAESQVPCSGTGLHGGEFLRGKPVRQPPASRGRPLAFPCKDTREEVQVASSPASPARPIMSAIAKRVTGRGGPKNEPIAEERVDGVAKAEEDGEPQLDKNFGYGKNIGAKFELGKEVGRGHFGHICWAKGKKGELKGQSVAVKVISKA